MTKYYWVLSVLNKHKLHNLYITLQEKCFKDCLFNLRDVFYNVMQNVSLQTHSGLDFVTIYH